MQQTTERLLYPRKDAAFQLGVSVRTLDYLIARKELETPRIDAKVLVTRKSFVRYASANHFGAVTGHLAPGLIRFVESEQQHSRWAVSGRT